MELRPYQRRVNYYETDQMAIVHHSNYIRWFEEARLDFLDQVGLNLPPAGRDRADRPGGGRLLPLPRLRPVRRLAGHLRHPHRIHGVKMCYRYEVRFHDTGVLAADGTSSHCFLDEQRRPIVLRRRLPEVDARLKSLVEKK